MVVISELFNDTRKISKKIAINTFGSKKTLEYALCCDENNITVIEEVLVAEFPIVGKQLCNKLKSLKTSEEKAACIWLFIRYRDKVKRSIFATSQQYDKEAIRR